VTGSTSFKKRNEEVNRRFKKTWGESPIGRIKARSELILRKEKDSGLEGAGQETTDLDTDLVKRSTWNDHKN
jgi:hypothetical protein